MPRRSPADVLTLPFIAALDARVDAGYADEVAFLREMVRVPTDTPPGDNAGHAAAHGRAARGDGLRGRAASRAAGRGRGRGSRLGDQPDRAPPLRRRPGDCPQRARRRRAAGRWLDPAPLRRRDRERAHVRSRRGGVEVRLRHLRVRAAGAGDRGPRARRPARGRGRAALHLRRGVRRCARAGVAAAPRAHAARPRDLRRVLVRDRQRAQRLPAARGHGRGAGGARGDARDRRRRAQGGARDPHRAVRARARLCGAPLEGRRHRVADDQRRPHRGRHPHQRRAGEGGPEARSAHDSRGGSRRGRGGVVRGDRTRGGSRAARARRDPPAAPRASARAASRPRAPGRCAGTPRRAGVRRAHRR